MEPGRSGDSLWVRSSSLFDFQASEFLGPDTARDSDEFTWAWLPQFRCARRKRSGVSHARLWSRHPAPTSQSRFSSTKAEIRKVVDLDESFHTHRHDAITGAKKKKPCLERFLHHQEANHCLLWRSRARRATQGSSTAQVVAVHSDQRARQASTSQSKNYSWKNLVDDKPASLLWLWCCLAVCIWHDKVKSVQRTDDPADRGPHQSPFSYSNVILPEKMICARKA